MPNKAVHLYRDEEDLLVVSSEAKVGAYTTTVSNLEELQDSPGLAEKVYGDVVDKVQAKTQAILGRRRLLNKRK